MGREDVRLNVPAFGWATVHQSNCWQEGPPTCEVWARALSILEPEGAEH